MRVFEAVPVDAVTALEHAIERGDTRLTVAVELVRAYASCGRDAEALALMGRIAALAPRADVQVQLSRLARQADRWDLVELAERRYTELLPDDPAGWQRLAAVCRRRGHDDDASAAIRRWAMLAPDDPVAQHLGAAAAGRSPARAQPDYVRQLFDSYAPRFDEHLGALDYRAPQLIADAVIRVTKGRRLGRAVDLGCGTGLLGPLVRGAVEHLVGVDLSPAMLAKAHDRGVYDELIERDLVDFLAATRSLDLVMAVDTLNYFGDLRPVFDSAARALVPHGTLAFTLESDDTAGDYRLLPSGRFGHDEQWVTDTVVAAGFTIATVEHATLRREGGVDVAGLVVVAAPAAT